MKLLVNSVLSKYIFFFFSEINTVNARISAQLQISAQLRISAPPKAQNL